MDFKNELKHPQVNTGDWFLSIFIANIPVLGLIMLVVWAFDKTGNPNKANWAKAKLIWYAVAMGIGVIFLILMGIGLSAGIFDNWDFPDF